MLRFRLRERLAERLFVIGERTTITEVSKATGINRVTLSKMINERGYGTVSSNLDRSCKFFGCSIEQLVEYVPDEEPVAIPHSPSRPTNADVVP